MKSLPKLEKSAGYFSNSRKLNWGELRFKEVRMKHGDLAWIASATLPNKKVVSFTVFPNGGGYLTQMNGETTHRNVWNTPEKAMEWANTYLGVLQKTKATPSIGENLSYGRLKKLHFIEDREAPKREPEFRNLQVWFADGYFSIQTERGDVKKIGVRFRVAGKPGEYLALLRSEHSTRWDALPKGKPAVQRSLGGAQRLAQEAYEKLQRNPSMTRRAALKTAGRIIFEPEINPQTKKVSWTYKDGSDVIFWKAIVGRRPRVAFLIKQHYPNPSLPNFQINTLFQKIEPSEKWEEVKRFRTLREAEQKAQESFRDLQTSLSRYASENNSRLRAKAIKRIEDAIKRRGLKGALVETGKRLNSITNPLKMNALTEVLNDIQIELLSLKKTLLLSKLKNKSLPESQVIVDFRRIQTEVEEKIVANISKYGLWRSLVFAERSVRSMEDSSEIWALIVLFNQLSRKLSLMIDKSVNKMEKLQILPLEPKTDVSVRMASNKNIRNPRDWEKRPIMGSHTDFSYTFEQYPLSGHYRIFDWKGETSLSWFPFDDASDPQPRGHKKKDLWRGNSVGEAMEAAARASRTIDWTPTRAPLPGTAEVWGRWS